jgi:hypothetical protein
MTLEESASQGGARTAIDDSSRSPCSDGVLAVGTVTRVDHLWLSGRALQENMQRGGMGAPVQSADRENRAVQRREIVTMCSPRGAPSAFSRRRRPVSSRSRSMRSSAGSETIT